MSEAISGIGRGWPPEQEIVAIRALDLRVLPGPHPILAAHTEAIAENWEREVAANPALFNGQMVLQHRLAVKDGVIIGEGYLAPFAAFLWWRNGSRPPAACHLAAIPVIETSDGAVIAVRMSAGTANPGKVYCAAGSIDASDIITDARGDLCDVPGNMRREVLEETGLDLAEASPGGFHALHLRGAVTLFRRLRFAESAATLLSRIERFTATSADQEIDGAVAIFNADPAAHNYQPFMPLVLAHVFSGQALAASASAP
jgi:8-oxo-dGTP pyrophosphatase MutT (NUDIX family)